MRIWRLAVIYRIRTARLRKLSYPAGDIQCRTQVALLISTYDHCLIYHKFSHFITTVCFTMEITRRAVIFELSRNGMRPRDIMSATFMMSRLLTVYSGHGHIDCRFLQPVADMMSRGRMPLRLTSEITARRVISMVKQTAVMKCEYF